MGDWNVAPLDSDVGDPALVPGVSTHISPPERSRVRRRSRAPGSRTWCARSSPTAYTYWDYKQLRFPRNEGLRIDFILGLEGVRRPGDGREHPPQRAQGRRRRATTSGARRARPRAVEEDDDDRPMIFG